MLAKGPLRSPGKAAPCIASKAGSYSGEQLADASSQPPPDLSILPHTPLPTRDQSSRRVSTMNTPSSPKHSSEPISSA